MRDSLAETTKIDAVPHRSIPSTADTAQPEISDWLAGYSERLCEHWYREVLRRSGASDPVLRGLLRDFLSFLTSLLPSSVRSDHSQVGEIWKSASSLYGSLGALRGLAAGEVVEEFQVVRDAVLRVVFAEPPVLMGANLKLREALRINRFIDDGVTMASVGHTDGLFFQLLEGSGVPSGAAPELLEEIRAQLDGFRQEVDSLTGVN